MQRLKDIEKKQIEKKLAIIKQRENDKKVNLESVKEILRKELEFNKREKEHL